MNVTLPGLLSSQLNCHCPSKSSASCSPSASAPAGQCVSRVVVAASTSTSSIIPEPFPESVSISDSASGAWITLRRNTIKEKQNFPEVYERWCNCANGYSCNILRLVPACGCFSGLRTKGMDDEKLVGQFLLACRVLILTSAGHSCHYRPVDAGCFVTATVCGSYTYVI